MSKTPPIKLRSGWTTGACATAAAKAAAQALLQNTEMEAADIVKKSLSIAGDICVYTNHNIIIEEVKLLEKTGGKSDFQL